MKVLMHRRHKRYNLVALTATLEWNNKGHTWKMHLFVVFKRESVLSSHYDLCDSQ